MKNRASFTVTLGLFLLIEGIWGFFSPVVFGVFSTNTLHAVIHLLLGAIGIFAGSFGRSQGYLFFVGLLLLVVGVLWFLSGATELVVHLLNVNRAVAILNVVIGIVSLVLARPASVSADSTAPFHQN